MRTRRPPRFVRRFAAAAFLALALSAAAMSTLAARAPQSFLLVVGVFLTAWGMAIAGMVSVSAMRAQHREHDRARRDMMADIAHELRTPLTVMQGTLEGLLDGVYPRDDAHVRQLLEETQVLSRLVDDLRTLALSEAGALRLQKETVDVAELARDVVNALSRQAADRQVSLATAAAEPVTIEADPVRLRQVIANLVTNSLHATSAGGRVTVRVTPAARGVSIEVHDTGRGMTPDELARAFDRFYKGTDSRGSGLGLTIARHLVEAHGGEIHASSEAGRGTVVTVGVAS